MSALLHSIKLTSHINPRVGYDSRPHFDTEVWSLLVEHKLDVEDVCFFANSFWHGDRRRLPDGRRVSARINSLGAFAQLGDVSLEDARRRTNEAGHFSVLYFLSTASNLLPRLVNLYPHGREHTDERRDDLGMKEDETTELRRFVQTQSPTHSIIGFAANADPCYIFNASIDALSLVLDRAALLAQPSVW